MLSRFELLPIFRAGAELALLWGLRIIGECFCAMHFIRCTEDTPTVKYYNSATTKLSKRMYIYFSTSCTSLSTGLRVQPYPTFQHQWNHANSICSASCRRGAVTEASSLSGNICPLISAGNLNGIGPLALHLALLHLLQERTNSGCAYIGMQQVVGSVKKNNRRRNNLTEELQAVKKFLFHNTNWQTGIRICGAKLQYYMWGKMTDCKSSVVFPHIYNRELMLIAYHISS